MATQQIKGSKRYRSAVEMTDLTKTYSVEEASALLNKLPKAKFDETVEIYAHLTVDPRKSDQMVRGTLSLPNGSGKTVRVIVFTENPDEAKEAGADEAGLDDLIEKVSGGWTDFDVAIATTSAMKSVRKVARVLGPRGLMPNPKSGTVTDDIPAGIKEVKGGRVEFKMDKTANVAIVVGKRSFTPEQITENAEAAIKALTDAKPQSTTGKFLKSLTLSATMSPGISVDAAPYNKS
ncbi:50S ribosomal protein L1 [Coraliomargarita sinensis]|uniref:Large ribosomal subunit protein uL1 n=1 Tax=Coraliomargarita sinensis TaxID=2174842 RepID=A0A317ZGW6_9BACT|nr:50S ribosomal protein L1 [Coraliomargarita sinensis]PXA03473.1 50S ribosomal protein L1 [Coraliomargarita sinensis]